MKTGRFSSDQAGFALVITLSLLALLVLVVFALSALTRVNSQIATVGLFQTQARQNAQLALTVALSELQRHAGDDTRLTGMAGITGIVPLASNSTRHWCGVWRSDGSFVVWLASGAQPVSAALLSGVPAFELVSSGSVGAATSNSEHVIAGKIPIVVAETPGAPGTQTTIGHYAFLVSDEGVKTPAYSPAPFPVVGPVIFASTTNAQSRLRDALATYAASVPKVISYEQLALLPTPASVLTPLTLQDNFHHTTLTSRFVSGAQLTAGMLNVNTTSVIGWRNLLQTYNTVPGVTPIASVTSRGNSLGNNFASTTAGKAANGPFTSTVGFATYLATIFPITGSPNFTQIMTAIGPLLTVRSDTFRVRAYGEALNSVPEPGQAVGKVEATAYCEAMVQRTLQPVPGFGRRFVITYFRWLGADDI